ncbi:amidase [Litorivita sp. NS0012-18]
MDILELEGAVLASMLARRDLSAAEVMEACLDRIEAANGAVNAVVALQDREALMDAARGADNRAPKGPLHGMPIAVKDLANVAGIPTTMGSPLMRNFVPKSDTLAIGRMREAGAIFIGKTNSPEFGLGSHTVNPVYGATHNPYCHGKSAGGSSGGAAAALAARMQWLCDGSDMMGSLRNPAGWNNVYGFRPTYGRIPGEPLGDQYMHPLATYGPMARTVRDLALLLDVMSGPDPRVPFSAPREAVLPHLEADVAGRRIGWLGDWGGAMAMEDGVIETCEAGLAGFTQAGCTVEAAPPPFDAEQIWRAWIDLRAYANAARIAPFYNDPDKRKLLRDDVIWEVERGMALSGAQVQAASNIRSAWFAAAAKMLQTYDAVVLPTAQVWPFDVEIMHPKQIAGRAMQTYHHWMEATLPASLLGLPAMGMPCGFGAAGLPMGLQLIGPWMGDLGVLQIGHAYHQVTQYPQRFAPALARAERRILDKPLTPRENCARLARARVDLRPKTGSAL